VVKTLYILDGSCLFRERLVEMLAEVGGIEVVGHSEDLCRALREIRELKPDAVMLEVRLPGRSGIDLIPEIKAAASRAMIVMLADVSYHQYRQRSLDAGADDFFDKNQDLERLIGVLSRRSPRPGGRPRRERRRRPIGST
jgi:two-component system nitrate/nitrite response regulator NarL